MKSIILILFCIFLWACSEGDDLSDTSDPEDIRRRSNRSDIFSPDSQKKSPFGEDVESITNRTYTKKQLRQYVESGQIDEIKNFLEVTSNANVRDADGHTLLHLAIINNNLELMDLLLHDPRIDVNERNYKFKYTALHIATQVGNIEMVTKLVSHPEIDINQVAKLNYTALHLSILYEHTDITRYFCNHPDINVHIGAGDEFITPLHLASIYGPVETVRCLLDKGAHPLMLSKNRITPLTLAINYENQEIIDLLLLAIKQVQEQAGLELQHQQDNRPLSPEFTRKPPKVDIPSHSNHRNTSSSTATQTAPPSSDHNRVRPPSTTNQTPPSSRDNNRVNPPSTTSNQIPHSQNSPSSGQKNRTRQPSSTQTSECQNNKRTSNLRYPLKRCQEEPSTNEKSR